MVVENNEIYDIVRKKYKAIIDAYKDSVFGREDQRNFLRDMHQFMESSRGESLSDVDLEKIIRSMSDHFLPYEFYCYDRMMIDRQKSSNRIVNSYISEVREYWRTIIGCLLNSSPRPDHFEDERDFGYKSGLAEILNSYKSYHGRTFTWGFFHEVLSSKLENYLCDPPDTEAKRFLDLCVNHISDIQHSDFTTVLYKNIFTFCYNLAYDACKWIFDDSCSKLLTPQTEHEFCENCKRVFNVLVSKFSHKDTVVMCMRLSFYRLLIEDEYHRDLLGMFDLHSGHILGCYNF